jgi:hypothetical protein
VPVRLYFERAAAMRHIGHWLIAGNKAMRHLIFLLIAINCVYFGWQVLRYAPAVEVVHNRARPPPPGIRRLVTLQEKDARQSAEARPIEEVTVTEPPSAASPTSCKVLGPFLAESKLEEVRKRLNTLGLVTRPQTRYVPEQVGYTVLLAEMAYDEALRIKRKLEEQNITAYILGTNNIISLGVFKEKSHAEKVLTSARAIGLDPHLEPSYAKRTTRWLVLQDKSPRNAGVAEIIKQDAKLRLEQIACP